MNARHHRPPELAPFGSPSPRAPYPLLAVLLALSVAGCQCAEDPATACAAVPGNQPDHPGVCRATNECADHHACSTPKGEGFKCCLFAERPCDTEADCCPGQTCPGERRRCVDKALPCSADVECGGEGDRYCEAWTDPFGVSGSRCRYRPCGPGGECPSGQSCFQGECLAGLPCGGGCEPGKACVPSIDRCQSYACPATCAPGHIATFVDNRNVWDRCDIGAARCVCAELPKLNSPDVARFSALAPDPARGELWVSAYDGVYGDLVVSRFDAAGALLAREYVDGVPQGAPARYAPSGPRGGATEPGDDVGRYTSVAVAGGRTYVSYYDASHGDLKLAIRSPDGSWSVVRVDGADGDVGLYSSVAVDSQGLPAVAYFQRAGSAGFDLASCPTTVNGDRSRVSALKLARATRSVPGEGNFTFKTLACQLQPLPPCLGCQGVCVQRKDQITCLPASSRCASCPSGQACVVAEGASECASLYAAADLRTLEGVGLHTALAFRGREANVVYLRRVQGAGELHGVTVAADGAVSGPVLLDGIGDTGHFPDIAVNAAGTEVAVSYFDAAAGQLKVTTGPRLSSALGTAARTVDTGLAARGDLASVGADSALAYALDGKLFVTYQDSTRGDLKLAARESGTWKRRGALRHEGSVGYFNDAAFLGGQLFVSHARIHARQSAIEPKVDNTLLLERLTP